MAAAAAAAATTASEDTCELTSLFESSGPVGTELDCWFDEVEEFLVEDGVFAVAVAE